VIPIPIIGEILDNVLGIFNSRTNANTANNGYQLGSQQAQDGYYYSSNNAQCVALNHRINTEVEACAAKNSSGFFEYFSTNLAKERSICRADIERANNTQIADCTKAISEAPILAAAQKKQTQAVALVLIIAIIITIIILKS
jgi:hypothetical protein